ncbi:MAG: Mur ligase family protein [Nitrospinota bacterium]|nr:Mur ligase family protein [Nitrospinota bacterium]
MNSKEVIGRLDKFLNSLSPLPKKIIKKKQSRNIDSHFERIMLLVERLEISFSDFEFINVVGTSGKGSTTMMISECLHESGKSVGSFFSPHITSIIERFWFNGRFVEPKLVSKVYDSFVSTIKKISQEGQCFIPTFFESSLVVFLLMAKEINCEVLVLEAGIGGKYDVTRIPFSQKLCVITKVALDHTELLGKTVSEIARDKAGIIAENGRVIVSKNHYVVKREISKISKKKSAKLYSCPTPEQVVLKQNCTVFNLNFSDGSFLKNLSIPMFGEHQVHNAALAAGACKLMNLDNLSISKGLSKSRLPGRIEIVSKNPTVILDVAHNRDKVKALIQVLKRRSEGRLFFIVGCLEGKDSLGIIEELSETKGVFLLTLPPVFGSRKYVSFSKLGKMLMKNRIRDFQNFIDPWDALKQALRLIKRDDVLVITGSSYLVGELRKFWFEEDYILESGNLFARK